MGQRRLLRMIFVERRTLSTMTMTLGFRLVPPIRADIVKLQCRTELLRLEDEGLAEADRVAQGQGDGRARGGAGGRRRRGDRGRRLQAERGRRADRRQAGQRGHLDGGVGELLVDVLADPGEGGDDPPADCEKGDPSRGMDLLDDPIGREFDADVQGEENGHDDLELVAMKLEVFFQAVKTL